MLTFFFHSSGKTNFQTIVQVGDSSYPSADFATFAFSKNSLSARLEPSDHEMYISIYVLTFPPIFHFTLFPFACFIFFSSLFGSIERAVSSVVPESVKRATHAVFRDNRVAIVQCVRSDRLHHVMVIPLQVFIPLKYQPRDFFFFFFLFFLSFFFLFASTPMILISFPDL